MEPLLFADTRHAVPAFRENAPEWAFSKRKGIKTKVNFLISLYHKWMF